MAKITVGEDALVGARSVVTKDVPDDVIAAGNPCKVIVLALRWILLLRAKRVINWSSHDRD